jgi:hypothetical protein
MMPPVLTKTAWDEQKKLPITGPSRTERTDKELEDILHSEEREGCERELQRVWGFFPGCLAMGQKALARRKEVEGKQVWEVVEWGVGRNED